MEIKIEAKKESPLLHRVEVVGAVSGIEKTPSNADIKKKLAVVLKASEELIVIKKIVTHFRSHDVEVIAYQYEDAEKLREIEPRNKKAEKEAAAAAKKA